MPRRRATKLTSRAKPKLPAGDVGSGMTKEERKAKLDVILRDFDMEVETRLAKMERDAKSMCKAIHRAVNMEIIKMPPSVKKMTVEEFFASGGSFSEKALQDYSETVNSLASSICSKSGSAVIESNSSHSEAEENAPSPPPAPPAETTSKRGRARKTTSAATATRTSRRRGARTAKSAESDDENATPAQAQTRKSTRTTRSRRGGAAKTQFETPAANTGKAGLINFGLNTPVVTPKFDPRLPLTPAVMREARKGETIMSMSGSPINNPARLNTEKPGILTLGNGKVIDVSSDADQIENYAMDETTRKNMQLLQENLARLLHLQNTSK